jgi:cAMP-specific phosphodiesterase 4
MDSILHAADISNPFKPFHIYDVWCKKVLEEFWQ